MAFNADTYRANKCRKEAWAELAKARDIKARAARGDAYDWEVSRIAHFVAMARSSMRGYLNWTQIASIKRKPTR